MNGNNNEEARLIILETKFEMLTENLTNAISRLEKKLDQREESYVTKEVLDEKLKQRDEKIVGLQNAIIDLRESKKETRSLLPNWAGVILTLGSLIIALIAFIKGMG
ncbi:hypothetical protein D3C87_971920 [compost metagenome]